ncbi:SIMPL domain-containing protein [Candidatus Microgenomates bacterium]|nr:SIMPL domain-containing protein [Candidatus Microgenomates bacterium]
MLKKYYSAIAIIVIGIITLSIAVASFAYYVSTQRNNLPSFSVSGVGKSVFTPDIAQFNFSVISSGDQNKDVAKLQKDNAEKINRAIDYIKKNGVDSKDIKTSGYNLNPEYEYYDCSENGVCPPPAITGYRIEQTVEVKIRDFSKVGEILNGVVKNGANSVSGLYFTIEDKEKVENEARGKAMESAREKALFMAKSGGFRLGKLVSVYEDNYPVPMYAAEGLGRGGDGVETDATSPSSSIEPGSTEVAITVNLTYEIR